MLVFQLQTPSGFLEYLVLPGTIAFLLVSGGHAGASHWAQAIAPVVAVLANMVAYALVVIVTSKILHLMNRKGNNP